MTMTESPDELFSQIWHIHTQTGHLSERYHLLDQLIVRTVKNHTAGFSADFTNFSSRLHTLCRTTGCPSRPLEIFRAHVHRIETKQYDANEKDYLYDLKAVCDSIARFCQAQIPANLQTILPTHWRSLAKSDRASKYHQKTPSYSLRMGFLIYLRTITRTARATRLKGLLRFTRRCTVRQSENTTLQRCTSQSSKRQDQRKKQ